MTPARRLAAILAVDVVGYSRLMGEDEAGDGAAYAHAGKMDEAKAALAEARRRDPELTIKWMIDHAPNLPPLFDGLRKAGLPEE